MGCGTGGGAFMAGPAGSANRRLAQKVLTDELKERGIKPPSYYTGSDILVGILVTALVLTVIFFIIWELT